MAEDEAMLNDRSRTLPPISPEHRSEGRASTASFSIQGEDIIDSNGQRAWEVLENASEDDEPPDLVPASDSSGFEEDLGAFWGLDQERSQRPYAYEQYTDP